MKEIILKTIPANTVQLGDVNTRDTKKYYGAEIGNSENNRGFITREQYGSGEEFTVRSMDELTYGNGWDGYNRRELSGTIEQILESGNKVFVFDTFKELVDWMTNE